MERRPDLSLLAGCEVTRVCLDYEVHLLLAAWHDDLTERVGATLTLGTPFSLSLAGASPVTVQPDTGAGYVNAVALLRRSIQQASADDRGVLTVQFHDGAALATEPSSEFESWALNGVGVNGWLEAPG